MSALLAAVWVLSTAGALFVGGIYLGFVAGWLRAKRILKLSKRLFWEIW